MKCPCGKGYACEDWRSLYYGKCRPCFLKGMPRKKRKEFEYSERKVRAVHDANDYGIF